MNQQFAFDHFDKSGTPVDGFGIPYTTINSIDVLRLNIAKKQYAWRVAQDMVRECHVDIITNEINRHLTHEMAALFVEGESTDETREILVTPVRVEPDRPIDYIMTGLIQMIPLLSRVLRPMLRSVKQVVTVPVKVGRYCPHILNQNGSESHIEFLMPQRFKLQ